MPDTFTKAQDFVIVHCGGGGGGSCDVTFAMSRRFYDRTHETGQTWYCPNGHPRIWAGPTLTEQLETAKSKATHLADQLHAAEVEAEATRRLLIRDRHRFANGVCPCCHRSFPVVARHMAQEHPDYDAGDLSSTDPEYRCSCGRSFATPRGLRVHQGHARGTGWANPATPRWRRHLTKT